MEMLMKTKLLCLLITVCCFLTSASAEETATAPATQPAILKNGDFAVDSNGDGIPDEWPIKQSEGISWVKEDDKIILKLVSSEEGKNYMLYHRMDLPKD